MIDSPAKIADSLAGLDERDAAARELALDPTRSILLEAPAGSGKTTVLTRRFLRLLCVVDEPEQILAITFTRKAAGEMRERILSALRSGAQAGGPMRELIEAVLARSRARGWSLEVDPGRLRIQTIDSLNRWLASQLPLAARSAGDAEVMEAPRVLYRRAARRTLLDAESDERLASDAARLFERLDNDFGRFERLLTDMLEVRGHWLPVLLGSAAGSGSGSSSRSGSSSGSRFTSDAASGLGDTPLHARGEELPARVEESLRAIVAERLRRAAAAIPRALIVEGAQLANEAARRRAAAEAEARASWRRDTEAESHLGLGCITDAVAESESGVGCGSDTIAESEACASPGEDAADVGASECGRGSAAADSVRAPWRAWLDPPSASETLSLRHWQGLARLALTAEGTWRRSLTKREGFATGGEELKALKARALDWIADLSRIEGARELLVELSSLPEPMLSADDAAALGSLARLLQLAAGELAIVFAESRRVDFAHVAAAARQVLTDEGAPSDLALKLGADIRHILVDEFQDTSIEQLRLLEALTAGWEEGDGRTLFVVGDPMQSIYQFREAEVGLFLRAGTHGLGRVRLQPLALTRNFRARPALVEWLNETFPRCFPAVDDPRASAVRYRPCAAGRNGLDGDGAVHLHAAIEPQAEARAIVELVQRMRTGEPDASIAVLVASRAHAAPIAAGLETAGIPVAGVGLVPLGALPVVRDLEALARALDHFADRTAWLAVLRAPWCGLSLGELSALLEGTPSRTVWEAIHDEGRLALLAPDARARLTRTRGVLAQALERRDRLDLASWVEAAWLALGGPAACRDDAELDRAQAFLAHLAAWSSEPGWEGPLGLAERLEGLYASPDTAAADAVQIMTIHRAKGLEFDKIIVPALSRKLRANTEPLLRWLELPREPSGTDLLMAAIPPPWQRGSEPLTEYLKLLAARRAANERTRLLYVAATRARSELHLFAEPPARGPTGVAAAPADGTLLAALWPGLADRFPGIEKPNVEKWDIEMPGVGHPAAAGSRAPPPLVRLASDWRLPPLPPGPAPPSIAVELDEPAPVGEEPGRLARLEPGMQTAHAVARIVCGQLRRCARIGRLPPPGSAALARALRERSSRLGLVGEALEEAVRQALVMFDACLADPTLQWIFSPRHASIESPCRLSGVHEGRLAAVTVDRTFVDDAGVRWLICFDAIYREGEGAHRLTSEPERRRFERMLLLARALEPEPVRAGLYDPRVPELREIG